MRWFGGASAVAQKPAVPIPVRVAVRPLMEPSERDAYVKKASAVGVINGAVKEELLLAFLEQSGLGNYSLARVEAYLDDQFGKPEYYKATWGWRSLRSGDQDQVTDHKHVGENGRIFRSGIYQGRVPYPVLETVERIAAAVPGVYFFISDRALPGEGDPFLMVTAPGMNHFIVERWDEPSFRG